MAMQDRAALMVIHSKVYGAMNIKFARGLATFGLPAIHRDQVGFRIEPSQRSSRLGNQNVPVGKKKGHIAGLQGIEAEVRAATSSH
jgi:hypothetical protein